MIVKGLLELIFALLKIVFLPINLPALPVGIQSVLNELTKILQSAVGLLGIFVDLSVVKYLIPVVIVIANFTKIYDLVIYILKKIPFVGIE